MKQLWSCDFERMREVLSENWEENLPEFALSWLNTIHTLLASSEKGQKNQKIFERRETKQMIIKKHGQIFYSNFRGEGLRS
jgi:hypothetical protein